MPSFDIVSEVNMQEVDNALNQARKEVATRFDFKNTFCEMHLEKNKIKLTADNVTRIHALHELLINKLARRNVPLKNIERHEVEVAPTGHARQDFTILRGIPHDKAKLVTQTVRDSKLKVTCQIVEEKIRITGKSRDDLQAVIALLRSKDFGLALDFENFRN